MGKGLIITLPRFDQVTEYFYDFSEEIVRSAERKGFKIKKLVAEKANKKEFKKVISKLDYPLVVLNGHGNERSIAGHENKIILKSGENDSLIKDKITYTRACSAADILGKNCVKKGDGCFIGYRKPFNFLANTEEYASPLKDKTAKLFLEPSNLVPISLIKGNNALHAHENSKKKILKNIVKVIRDGGDDYLAIAQTLWSNYENQVLEGNELAKID